MSGLTRGQVETEVSRALDNLFESLDSQAQAEGVKPSELAKLLDQTNWGLGGDYREWFENGDYPFE